LAAVKRRGIDFSIGNGGNCVMLWLSFIENQNL